MTETDCGVSMSGISLLLAEMLSSGTYRLALTMISETPPTSWRTVSTDLESAGCSAPVSAQAATVSPSAEVRNSDGPRQRPASLPIDRFMDPPPARPARNSPNGPGCYARDRGGAEAIGSHVIATGPWPHCTDPACRVAGHRSTTGVATPGPLAIAL